MFRVKQVSVADIKSGQLYTEQHVICRHASAVYSQLDKVFQRRIQIANTAIYASS